MRERLTRIALIAFAALLGLLEGPAEIAAVAALVGIAASGGFRGWRPGLAERGISIWAIAGAVSMALASAKGMTPSSEDMFRPLLALGFLIGSRGVARADDRGLTRIAIAFMLGCVVSSVYGYLQVAVGELPLDRYFLKNPRSAQIWVPGKVWGVYAASGLFYNRLKLAHVGMAGLGLFGLMLLRRPRVSIWRRVILAVGAVIVAGAIVLTYSRMVLVGFVVAALLVAVVMRKRAALAVGVAAIGALAIAFVVARSELRPLETIEDVTIERNLVERVEAISEDLTIRRHLFSTAISVFRDHPLIGVGHGLYRRIAEPVYDGQGVLLDAHNLALHVLTETGLVGFLALTAALWACLARAGRAVSRDRTLGTPRAVRDRFALLGLTALLIIGSTHVVTHHAPVALLFWTLAGLAWASGEPPIEGAAD